jgi:hypothetical protein
LSSGWWMPFTLFGSILEGYGGVRFIDDNIKAKSTLRCQLQYKV